MTNSFCEVSQLNYISRMQIATIDEPVAKKCAASNVNLVMLSPRCPREAGGDVGATSLRGTDKTQGTSVIWKSLFGMKALSV